MWQLLLLLGAGIGVYSLVSEEEKEKEEKTPESKKERELTWKEEVSETINAEGFDYTFNGYSDWKEIKNVSFQNALKNYRLKRKELNSQISKLYKPKRDYVKMVIDKEGFDYAFDGYSNFDEYEHDGIDKPFNDKGFHDARKEYIKAYNRLKNLINK
jgi:hypothetical protein